ncbi:hypothetical protein E2C01_099461 [Portunus trituberculatus]|uniref:Uncharacterized protein n=1 Tax=Portunus trituberculatus TaxID=210409 RepID=A0A5B7KB14_PORTR|nr:hypothetical protein [Portunus trituberculatus]
MTNSLEIFEALQEGRGHRPQHVVRGDLLLPLLLREEGEREVHASQSTFNTLSNHLLLSPSALSLALLQPLDPPQQTSSLHGILHVPHRKTEPHLRVSISPDPTFFPRPSASFLQPHTYFFGFPRSQERGGRSLIPRRPLARPVCPGAVWSLCAAAAGTQTRLYVRLLQ